MFQFAFHKNLITSASESIKWLMLLMEARSEKQSKKNLNVNGEKSQYRSHAHMLMSDYYRALQFNE